MLNSVEEYLISQIIDRCHVGDSNRYVIRYVISRMKNKYETFRNLSREQRRDIMKAVVKIHGENREMYNFVMGGMHMSDKDE